MRQRKPPSFAVCAERRETAPFPPGYVAPRLLPNKLHSQLDDSPRGRSCYAPEGRGRNRSGRIAKAYLVEGVEKLSAKLYSERLADQDILHQINVRPIRCRSRKRVAAGVAIGAKRYPRDRHEGGGVE